MCGISGFNWDDKAMGKKMSDCLSHRGPDGEGLYNDEYVTLSHRRLAIIDLSARANQPMIDKNGNVIIFNGEMYNFKSVATKLQEKGYRFDTDSDTEVILKAYDAYGDSFLDHFNGMFAFCLYDATKKRLILARDRLGEKPLYYFFDGKHLIFASEIKAILQHEMQRCVLSESVRAYLKYRYIPGDQTIFDKIKRVPAGCYAEFLLKSKKLTIKKYWDVKQTIIDKPEKYFKDQTIELLKDSVRLRLVSDVPLGVYLSGGVDSTAIVSMMRYLDRGATIKTFSVGFDSEFDELKKAREMSDLFNTDHKEVIVNPDLAKTLPEIMKLQDDPIMDPANIPLYHLSKIAKKDVTVVLSGDGGDEVFAGYDHYKFLQMRDTLKPYPFKSLGVSLLKKVPRHLLNKVYKYVERNGEQAFERLRQLLTAKDNAEAYDALMAVFSEEELDQLLSISIKTTTPDLQGKESLNQYQQYDIKHLLPDYFLMKTDRSLMASGIEGRVPLLDHRLVQLGMSLPVSMKKHPKYIFKKALLEKKFVPKHILYSSKQAFFLPLDTWLEKDLMSEFKSVILDGQRLMDQKIFKAKEIQKMFDRFHTSKLYYAKQLWTLACFNYWWQEYMEK